MSGPHAVEPLGENCDHPPVYGLAKSFLVQARVGYGCRLVSQDVIDTVEDAWERVDWYSRRWIVEEYHKAKKSGAKIESLQFTTKQAIEPAIALLSVVAVELLSLREAARDPQRRDRPASNYVGTLAVRVLSVHRYKEARDLTVLEYTMALARLGGF